MSNERDETLRWPTNLNREAINKRLAEVQDMARARNLPQLVSLFADCESMSPAKLATNVISALGWLEGKPEYRYLTMQLEMVALNLKNLKQSS